MEAQKKAAKGAEKGKKRALVTLAETRPSPMGQRVVPRIDAALKAKYQKADATKEKNANRGQRGVVRYFL